MRTLRTWLYQIGIVSWAKQIAVPTPSQLNFRDGSVLLSKGRRVEKITLVLFDFGVLQDRTIIRQLMAMSRSNSRKVSCSFLSSFSRKSWRALITILFPSNSRFEDSASHVKKGGGGRFVAQDVSLRASFIAFLPFALI